MDHGSLPLIFAHTAVGVGVILALAAIGSAIGWGLICGNYMEGIARQPELRPKLTGLMLITGAMKDAFPMIILGLALWFVLANPFVDAARQITAG